MSLLEQVDETIQSRQLVQAGARMVVAVSGGLDSMVLLHLLHELAPDYGWHLAVAHYNHRLRGPSSHADERLVRQTAESLFLPCSVESGAVKRWAREKDLSVEMAARELRHQFLARAAQHHQAGIIALGHHAQDQVELFFLRLLRGAGAGGLSGMKWSGPSPADASLTLVRPLLDQPKAALLEYSAHHKIKYHEDATNAATDILRNRIRHKLLPLLLEEFQPSLDAVILRQMKILQAEDDYLSAVLQKGPGLGKSRPFSEWPVAIQRRWLQTQLQNLHLPLDFRLVEDLRLNAGKPVMAQAGLNVERDESGTVKAVPVDSLSFKEDWLSANLTGSHGEIRFQEHLFRWSIERVRSMDIPPSARQSEWFDADKVGRTVVLRHWQRGDRFQPIGLPRPTKLQDLFTNLKVPAAERRKRVLACTPEGEIWWVEGLRMAEGFKVGEKTRRRLLWSWG